jgi:transposase-like protein
MRVRNRTTAAASALPVRIVVASAFRKRGEGKRMRERYFGHAPAELRAAAVERYLTSNLTLEQVGEQFGTTRSTIHHWVKSSGSRALSKKQQQSEANTPDGRSPQDKLRLLLEASKIPEAERGEFLRREGLRDGDLERFEAEALSGLGGDMRSAADQRRLQELERVNAKQEKRLREAEVLLELQKKVHELWGAKDDDTTKR